MATLIQEHLKKDPFCGHLFVFRGKNASLLKVLLRSVWISARTASISSEWMRVGK
ncbi:IS66 family insertion sequence element accessory protein TnpB [Mesorhizobium sp. NPDC059025]|uniref:IS66 family insertion sequence element accessory protein TnpB n=1 Tax=unclassified Mesorhizobium TaxID=325217 RepID=UPI0036BA92DA